MKKIIRIPIALLLMCFTGYLMLVLTYCIPTKNMEAHVREAVNSFQKEGTYLELIGGVRTSELDNWTDALMLLTASHPHNKNVWTAAVDAERYYTGGKSPAETLVDVYGDTRAEPETVAYQRYWHGYLIFLKPLLLFFNYSQIRYLIMAGQICLFSLLIASLARQKKELVLPTVFLWLFMNPVTTMCSLQFSSIVTVTFTAMILMLWLDGFWKDDMDKWGMLFLCIGG